MQPASSCDVLLARDRDLRRATCNALPQLARRGDAASIAAVASCLQGGIEDARQVVCNTWSQLVGKGDAANIARVKKKKRKKKKRVKNPVHESNKVKIGQERCRKSIFIYTQHWERGVPKDNSKVATERRSRLQRRKLWSSWM